MSAPPGRRSPGADDSRATAENGLQTAGEADTEFTDRPDNQPVDAQDALALYGGGRAVPDLPFDS